MQAHRSRAAPSVGTWCSPEWRSGRLQPNVPHIPAGAMGAAGAASAVAATAAVAAVAAPMPASSPCAARVCFSGASAASAPLPRPGSLSACWGRGGGRGPASAGGAAAGAVWSASHLPVAPFQTLPAGDRPRGRVCQTVGAAAASAPSSSSSSSSSSPSSSSSSSSPCSSAGAFAAWFARRATATAASSDVSNVPTYGRPTALRSRRRRSCHAMSVGVAPSAPTALP